MKKFSLVFFGWAAIIISLGALIQEVSSTKVSETSRLEKLAAKYRRKSKSNSKFSKKLAQKQKIKAPKAENTLVNWVSRFFAAVLLAISTTMVIIHQIKWVIQFRRQKLAESICIIDNGETIQDDQDQKQKLVYVKGQTKAEEYFEEPVTKIGGNNLIKIYQMVEVLEGRKNNFLGKNKKNTQKLQWVYSNQGDSQNSPDASFIYCEIFYNQKVRLGKYELDQQILDQIQFKQKEFTLANQHIKRLQQHYQTNRKGVIVQNKIYFFPFTQEQQAKNQPFRGKSDMDLINEVQGTLRISFVLFETGPLVVLGGKSKEQQRIILTIFNIAQYQGEIIPEEDDQTGESYIENIKQYIYPFQQMLFVCQDDITKSAIFSVSFYQKQFHLAQGISLLCMFLGFWWIFCLKQKIAKYFQWLNLNPGRIQYHEPMLAIQVSFVCYMLIFVLMKCVYDVANNKISISVGVIILLCYSLALIL